MLKDCTITNLSEHPHHLDELANWYHQSFTHLTGSLTLEQRKSNLKTHVGNNKLPTTFLVLKDDELMGAVCLVENDLDSEHEYTPWLSRLFIHHQSRGKKMASALVAHAKAYTQNLGYQNIYLLTEHKQSFFNQFGFNELAVTNLNDYPVSIMMCGLNDDDECP